jgi:hypothetical protein
LPNYLSDGQAHNLSQIVLPSFVRARNLLRSRYPLSGPARAPLQSSPRQHLCRRDPFDRRAQMNRMREGQPLQLSTSTFYYSIIATRRARSFNGNSLGKFRNWRPRQFNGQAIALSTHGRAPITALKQTVKFFAVGMELLGAR